MKASSFRSFRSKGSASQAISKSVARYKADEGCKAQNGIWLRRYLVLQYELRDPGTIERPKEPEPVGGSRGAMSIGNSQHLHSKIQCRVLIMRWS